MPKSDQMVLAVRVKPGASRTKVGGAYDGRYGRALVVAVNAPPVDGAATRAVIEACATAFQVRKSAITLLAGATSRDKLLEVSPAPPGFTARLAALLEE
jgi:uncharacterized protein (TIGR00251 family)